MVHTEIKYIYCALFRTRAGEDYQQQRGLPEKGTNFFVTQDMVSIGRIVN
jgi:hypothetical protein